MKVSIKYFGLIAEKTGRSSENLEFPQGIESDFLLDTLKTKYPELCELPFKLAVNQELIIQKTEINNGAEVALLPAYAGG